MRAKLLLAIGTTIRAVTTVTAAADAAVTGRHPNAVVNDSAIGYDRLSRKSW